MEKRFIVRDEPWGRIVYDRSADEFIAEIWKNAIPIPTSPIGIGWVIVGGCNLKCVHCYGNAEELPSVVLSTNDCLRIVERIVEARVMRVVISGGEPLLRGDIFDVILAFAENDVSVVLGTNGAFIEKENVERLLPCTRVEISLDAATPELNDRIRPSRQKHSSAWLETMRAIQLCLEHGIRPRILTALNAWNQRQLVEMAALLHGLGVTDWAISWTVPAGRARANFDLMRPENGTAEASLETVRRTYPSLTVRYSNRASGYNRFYCLILPDGQMATEDIVLARKISFGSLLEIPIASAWKTENYDFQRHFEKWVGDRVRQI